MIVRMTSNHKNLLKYYLKKFSLNSLKKLYQARKFFEANTAHIEVLRQHDGEEIIEKTYFYIPPYCHVLKNVIYFFFNLKIYKLFDLRIKVQDKDSMRV